MGLLVTALAFFTLTIPSPILGGSGSSGYSIWWVLVYYALMALSDQLVGPIGSSLVFGLLPGLL